MSSPDPAREAGSFVEILRLWASLRPDRSALAFLDGHAALVADYSFARLQREADAVAARLLEVARPGDRALLLFPPGPEFVAAFFGCLIAGVVAVPAHPPDATTDAGALRAIAAHAGARVALAPGALTERVAPLPILAFEECVARPGAPAHAPAVGPDTVAFLQYTSGSTGRPRGVVVTHGNLLHNERVIREAFGHDSDRTIFAGWLPLYHDMGLIGNVLQPIYLGVTSYLMAPRDFIRRPSLWLKAISRYRATTSGGPSFAYAHCVDRIVPAEREELDLRSWEVAFDGAEPVRDDVIERFVTAFAPHGFRRESFLPCYGLAESTLFVTGVAALRRLAVDRAALADGRVVRAEGAGTITLVGCGHAFGGQEVAIVDPVSSARCEGDRVGEIWVRGPSVARGYFADPEPNQATFGARLLADPGGPWLRTGDLGFLVDGELYIAGRLKDVIIVHGRKHHPEDLERTVERASDSLRLGGAVAFSVDRDGEERVVVVHEVDRRRAETFDAAKTAADIRQAVANGHGIRVHTVAFVAAGAVPRTTSGKVQRRLCRTRFLDGALEQLGEPA
jgi:acyl-CoA synthetase (AMP-forming)/AMP-acid ligase II